MLTPVSIFAAKKVAAVKVNTKSLAAYSSSSKKAAAAAATASKKAIAATATSSRLPAVAAASSSKAASAAAVASASKVAASAASAASVASAKSASLAKLSSTKATTTTTTQATTKATTITTTIKSTTTTVPASTTSVPAASSLQLTALDEHNSFRALHGAPALTWNATLAAGAQEWADRCVFEHGEGAANGWGENLSAFAGTDSDIRAGIVLWEDEAKDYDPANPTYSHFTQLVWKSTREVGCAKASCAPGSIFDASYGEASYFVCEYYPPGNYIGEFAENVQ